jgi:hypothetical protein
MSQHVGTLAVCVIRYHEALRDSGAFLMQVFQDLNGLRAWGGAHVEYFMLALYLQ